MRGTLHTVQEGIAYAPEQHFYAFEARRDGVCLDFDVALDVLKRAGFPLVAEPILRGSFEECIGLDVDTLCTAIPGLLSLPLCEKELMIVEGVVCECAAHVCVYVRVRVCVCACMRVSVCLCACVSVCLCLFFLKPRLNAGV